MLLCLQLELPSHLVLYLFQHFWRESVWCAKDLKTISTHQVKQFSPALHGDTLEDGEDRKQDVVKLGDTVVWSQPVLSASGTLRTQPGRGRFSTRMLLSDLI